jgi:hypothetical protein
VGLSSYRNTLGVWKYSVKRRIARTIFTNTLAFRTKRLIVFLTPGLDFPSGGVWSIAAIYRETEALRDLHQAKVALCLVPGDPPLLKYTWFQNRNYLLDLEMLLEKCGPLDSLLLHIPEYAVNRLIDWLSSHATKLRNIRDLHLNVMVQNIDMIKMQDVSGLMRFGKVTCTTAHEAYTDLATREALGVPLHRLSCCNGPERYSLSGYQDKEHLLIVSNDEHPLKEEVIHEIKRKLPALEIQVIQNLSHEEYLNLVRRAKWSLTFGEGLDAYFADPIFSGGVSFAVYNERFFTPAFAELETVYSSWEVLLERMTTDLQRLDEPVAYERCWRRPYDLLSSLYSMDRFRQNLRLFHRGEYTFP